MAFVGGDLRIDEFKIIMNDEILCKDQTLIMRGVCGIVGKKNELRDALITLLTVPMTIEMVGLSFYGNFFCQDQRIEYDELRKMLNVFTLFYSRESVKDTLEFVNFLKARELMKAFEITHAQNKQVSTLSVWESRMWEAAINVASRSKVIVIRELLAKHLTKKKGLAFLKHYAASNGCVVLVELEGSPIDYKMDSCLIVGDDGFQSIDLSTELGVRRYAEFIERNIFREFGEYVASSSESESTYMRIPSMKKLLDYTPFESKNGYITFESSSIVGCELMYSPRSVFPKISRRKAFKLFKAGFDSDECKPHRSVGKKLQNILKSSLGNMFVEDKIIHKIECSTMPDNESCPRHGRCLSGKPQHLKNTRQNFKRCTNRESSIVERTLSQNPYSVDIRKALVLFRRRYIYKKEKVESAKKFSLTILLQIYLALFLRAKSAILLNTYDLLFVLPRIIDMVMLIIKIITLFTINHAAKRIPVSNFEVYNVTSRLLRCLLNPVFFIEWRMQFSTAFLKMQSWTVTDFKIMSTSMYFVSIVRSASIISEEIGQLHCYVNKIYTPGTYFAYILIYTISTTWVPVLLVSHFLGFTFALAYISTGTFIGLLLNLVTNIKLRYFLVCMILAFNLLYPLNGEDFKKGSLFKYTESVNILITCRELIFASPENRIIYIHRLVSSFLFIYVLFCYKLSKV